MSATPADAPRPTSRARLALAIAVSGLPSNFLRTRLYRWCFGYRIVNARVGFGTVIAVEQATLDHCTIGRFNRFVGPMQVSVGPGADIESHNVFDCGVWTASERGAVPYARELSIGREARITDHHFFDVAGRFVLGDGSWIAGRESQFWTHGVGVIERDITIGRRSYVGSAVRFAPGSGIADNVVVGLGSVVTKRIAACNAIVAGSPASVVSENRGWKPLEDESHGAGRSATASGSGRRSRRP